MPTKAVVMPGAERVLQLYEEGQKRAIDERESADGKTQQPALFDFARRRRKVVLARQP